MKFLATTALDDFWRKEQEIVFLGEWCKLYEKKDLLNELDYEIMEFDNSLDKKKQDILECNKHYEEILEELIIILNNYHQTNYSKHYWKILLSPWLLPFIQVVYEKYMNLQHASEKYLMLNTYIMKEEDYRIPNNFAEFNNWISYDDVYNLQIYSEIVKVLNVEFKEIRTKKMFNLRSYINPQSTNVERIMTCSTKLLNRIFNKKSIIVATPYFKKDRIKSILSLLFKSRFLFVFDNFKYDINYTKNANVCVRKNIFSQDYSDFKSVFFKLLIYNFPTIYLENYIAYNNAVDKLNVQLPNAVFSLNAFYINDIFRLFIAKNNLKVLYMQHGGGYGMESLLSTEKLERDIASVYFTQGWRESNSTVPLPKQEIVVKKKKLDKSINLIMTEMPRYTYRFNFTEDSSKMIDYIDNTISFLQNFKHIDDLNIRVYPNCFGWSIKQRLLDLNLDLNFDNETDYYIQIQSAKLNIFDHLHTGYLESLSMNVPTLIFFTKEVYSFRPEVNKDIQKLYDANILFHDTNEAISFINSIYADIDSWWFSEVTQKIVKEFTFKYARVSKNWTDDWIHEMQGFIDSV